MNEKMKPKDAVQLIGMNAALYQPETEPIEAWIIENKPFSKYAEHIKKIKTSKN